MRWEHPPQRRPPRCPASGILIGMLAVWILLISVSPAYPQGTPSLPHLRKQGTATQLIVHDKPFLMLGGELGNSSASDAKYMADVWPKLTAMRLNTILMPVYWELIEPRKGSSISCSLMTSSLRHVRTI